MSSTVKLFSLDSLSSQAFAASTNGLCTPPCSASATTRNRTVLSCAGVKQPTKQDARASARNRRSILACEFPPNRAMSVNMHRSRRRDFLRGYRRVKFQIEKPDHHFIPALLAPNDCLGRIRVFRIVWRIVETGGALNFCALWQINRIGKVVPKLPMPVIGGNTQNGLRFAIWKCQPIFKRFAARVHVRVQAD